MKNQLDNILSDVTAFFSPLYGLNERIDVLDNGTLATETMCYRLATCVAHGKRFILLFTARHPDDLLGYASDDPIASDILYKDRVILAKAFEIHQSKPNSNAGRETEILDLQHIPRIIHDADAAMSRANRREHDIHELAPHTYANEYLWYEGKPDESTGQARIVIGTKLIRDYKLPTPNGKSMEQTWQTVAQDLLISTSSTHPLQIVTVDDEGQKTVIERFPNCHIGDIALYDLGQRAQACWMGKDPISLAQDHFQPLKRERERLTAAIISARANWHSERSIRKLMHHGTEWAVEGLSVLVSTAIKSASEFGERQETDMVPEELLPLIAPHFPRFSKFETDLRKTIVRPDPFEIERMRIKWLDWNVMRPSFTNIDLQSIKPLTDRQSFTDWLIRHLKNSRIASISYHHEDGRTPVDILKTKEGTAWIKTSSGLQIFWKHGTNEAYAYYAPPYKASEARLLAHGADKFFRNGKALKISLESRTFKTINFDAFVQEVSDLKSAKLPSPQKPNASVVRHMDQAQRGQTDLKLIPDIMPES